MAYRSIDDTFWLSPKVRQLSTEEKLLYLYLISVATNAGLVRTIPEIIAVTVGFETGRIGGLLGALRDAGRVVWEPEKNLIWVVGQIDHQTVSKAGGLDFYKSRGLENEWQNLPQGVIRQAFEEKYGYLIKNTLKRGPKRPLDGASTGPPIKERKGKERKLNKTTKDSSCPKNQNFSDEVTNLTNLLISKILTNDAKAKTPPLSENGTQDPKWRKWAKEADLLLRVDERSFKEAEQLIHWCQDSNFWRANIRSMAKFREQYPQLRLKWKSEQQWQPEEKETESERIRRLTGG